jgi:5'-nucleotidase
MKNIFVVNDDSARSPGLSVLVKSLEKEYYLTVVTTKHFKSWTAKAITYNKEVLVEESSVSKSKAYVIDGYPADCVNIGLNHLVKEKQDLVFSGINIGENATDSWTLSSATVAATLEGVICGTKGIAISQQLSDEEYDEITTNLTNKPAGYYEKYFCLSGRVAKTVTKYVLENELPPEIKILNINIPPQEIYQGKWYLTKPYRWSYDSLFTKTAKGFIKTGGGFTEGKVKEEGTDMWALHNGYISITPYDLPLCPVINQKVTEYFAKLQLIF